MLGHVKCLWVRQVLEVYWRHTDRECYTRPGKIEDAASAAVASGILAPDKTSPLGFL
jgi:hypothetical protein